MQGRMISQQFLEFFLLGTADTELAAMVGNVSIITTGDTNLTIVL
jgi:hypothetical protein